MEGRLLRPEPSKGRRVKRFVKVESVARHKLRQLEIAGRLEDLRVPPGNRLEALKGGREVVKVTP